MSFTIYKSSAGSGKTSTLVTEYLTLALSNKPESTFRNILAITFTNKAANEMKERVLESLIEFASGKLDENIHIAHAIIQKLEINETELAVRSQRVLSDMLHHYADVSIGTIDSFVSRLVHTFAFDLHLPFQFRVELDGDSLLQRAVDSLVEQTGNDATITRILTQFMLHRINDESSRNIEQELLNKGRILLQNQFNQILEEIKDVQASKYLDIEQLLRETIKSFEEKSIQYGTKGLEMMTAAGMNIEDFPYKSSGMPAAMLKLQQLNFKEYPGKRILGYLETGQWLGKKASAGDEERVNQFKGEWENYIHEIMQGIPHYIACKLMYNTIYQQASLSILSQLIDQVQEDLNIIHLSDFNAVVNELVLNEPVPFIYERVGERYHHYLVDEFQDTSTIQWQNLLPLYSNSLASNYFNMVVGDGKQSIYRWRGGDVEQFLHLGDEPDGSEPEYLKEHLQILHRTRDEKQLNQNFRSCKEVIEFNNAFFKQASTVTLSDDLKGIYDQLEQTFNPDKTGGLVQYKAYPEDNPKRGVSDEQVDWLKSELKQTLDHLIQETHFKPGDICFLLRSRKHAIEVANWLKEWDIPIFTNESLLLSNSPDVALIMSLMKWYVTPNEPIHAVEVIIRLKEFNNTPTSEELHIIMLQLKQDPLLLFDVLKSLELDIPNRYLDEISMYGFYQSLLQALNLTVKTNAFLSKLGNLILDYEEKEGNNLGGFVNHYNERKDRLSIESSSSENAVQLMTIHKSKGLQFPVVIVPMANWIGNTQNQAPIWVKTQEEELDLPYSMMPFKKELESTVYAPQKKHEDDRKKLDELNELYVAFTRPKQRLYIFDHILSGANKEKIEAGLSVFDTYDFEQKKLVLGDGTAQPKERKESEPAFEIGYSKSPWKERINLSTQRVRELENHADEQHFGQYMHLTLEKIQSTSSLKSVEQWLMNEPIENTEKSKIWEQVNQLISWPELAPYFDSNNLVWNEVNLMYNGQKKRADRIVEFSDKVSILDYKTGEVRPEHEVQIREYAGIVQHLIDKPLELILVYTDKPEIHKVSFQSSLF